MSLVNVVCVVRERSLRRADHSSRGVLQTVVRRCVWSKNLANEEAMAHWGLLRRKQMSKVRISLDIVNETQNFCGELL